MTEFINQQDHPTLFKSVTRAREAGWKVGFFRDGEPEGLVFRDHSGVPQTKDGVPITYEDDLKLGVYRWVKK